MIAAVRSQPRGTARDKPLLQSPMATFGVGLILTVIIIVASSAAASAQSFINPVGTVSGEVSGWATQAIGWAQHIYISLLAFELIALAITTLLFRENLGEFFASVSLKVFVGGVYFWFINNAGAGGWPSKIIGMFQSFGTSLGGVSPTDGTSWLTVEGLTAATAYFLAGPAAQLAAQTLAAGTATTAGTILAAPGACTLAITPGALIQTCPGYVAAQPLLATIPSIMNQSYPFTLITEGMGLMIVMALAAIWLQVIIMTIESYMVMGAGVLFIGFAGSRFTMPFSQGYFSYMFNVGVKFMVLYIVLGVEQSLMPAILTSAVTALSVASVPGAEYAALIAAAFGMVNVIIAAALVWMLPGLAGSFLTGQSSASGSAVLGQVMGQMGSAATMMANLHQAKRSDAAAKRSGAAAMSQNVAARPEGHQDMGAPEYGSHDNSTTSPVSSMDPFGGGNSNARALSNGLASTPSQGSEDSAQDRAEDRRAMADTYRANAMASLASAAPRDIGGPTAVQVRISNPDKL